MPCRGIAPIRLRVVHFRQAVLLAGFSGSLLFTPIPALAGGVSGVPDGRPAPPGIPCCEPPVREVQEAAARYARLTPSAIDRVARAGRGTALLPAVRVMYRDITSDANRDATTASGATTNAVVDNTGVGWEVSLEWRLDQLGKNPARVQAIREAVRLEERQTALLTQVTRLYFDRRRALLDVSGLEGKDRAARQLDADELTGDLDALTGGWFSRRLQGKEGGR